MIYLSIDSIEGDYAACEADNGKLVYIKLELLPDNIKESDVIELRNDGSYIINKDETDKRKQACKDLYSNFFTDK